MDQSALSSRRHAPPHDLTHLVALEEGGMPGLAEYLLTSDRSVSASITDSLEVPERFSRMGLRIHRGHSPAAVPPAAHRLVYPPQVAKGHPERLRALRRGVDQIALSDALADAFEGKRTVTVVGGRVARVASTMIGWVLSRLGLDPTLVLGAESLGGLGYGRAGGGAHGVLELPESLLSAGPKIMSTEVALILDLHRMSGGSRRKLRELAESLPDRGLILVDGSGSCPELDPAFLSANVARLSLEPTGEWWGADLREDGGRYRFRVFHEGRFILELRLACHGRRFVLAALAAIAVCCSIDLSVREIREALEDFPGIARAFSHRGTYRGVTLIDDDATEPSDVTETLSLARMIYGRRRLWAVYGLTPNEAVSLSCLADADRVLLLGNSAGSPRDLESDGDEAGERLRCAEDHEEAIRNLDRHLEPGDVLVTLGFGEMGTIADAFIRRLPRDRQSR